MLRILITLIVIGSGLGATDGDVASRAGEPAAVAPAVAAWMSDSDAETRQRLVLAEPIARAREARDQHQAAIAAGTSPAMIVLAAMVVAALVVAASWGWLSYCRTRPRTARGLAIELGEDGRRGKTTVICLIRPGRAATVSLERDRAREAEIRAAAAQPEDPPTDPVIASDTKGRIAHKHETAIWQRAQRERLKDLKPAASRVRLLRRA